MNWGRRGFDATPNQRETIREETMPRTLLARSLGMIGLAAIVAAPMAWAQDAPPVRVRGTIERVGDPVYVIKARDGAELKLTVAAKHCPRRCARVLITGRSAMSLAVATGVNSDDLPRSKGGNLRHRRHAGVRGCAIQARCSVSPTGISWKRIAI
jgi:hypothetical protein